MIIDFNDDLGATTASTSSSDIKAQAHVANGGEGLQGCRKCGGSGMTRWGRCFACQGKGQISKGRAAAQLGAETKRANHAEFVAQNGELIAYLGKASSWSSFAADLLAKINDGSTLSEGQLQAVRNMMAKSAAKIEAIKASKRGEVDIAGITALFDRATSNAVKSPIFRCAEITISKAKEHSKNPGSLYVKSTVDGRYLGKITNGQFEGSYDATAATLDQLRAVAANPADEAIRYAREFKRCGCCGKGLRNPVSVLAVIGPTCAENWGLEGLREAAAEELKRLEAEEAEHKAQGGL